MADANELRGKATDELKALFEDLSKEIYQVRNEFKVTKKIEKTHLIKEKKRTRAQILTIWREQEIRSSQAEGRHGKS